MKAMAEQENDDIPTLSAYTLAALQEFYDEQTIKRECDDIVQEDWQLSQFWYSTDTTTVFTQECIRESKQGNIACISCPTLYSKLSECRHSFSHLVLLEYDQRFSKYGDDYVYYDYNTPLNVPQSVQNIPFDLVVADPPFLSEECLTKVAQTIKLLTNKKILLCTVNECPDDFYCRYDNENPSSRTLTGPQVQLYSDT